MVEAQARCPIRILGYCLMPNHWHCVLWPSNHLRVHYRKTLGGGQGAKSMVGTDEFARLTGFVQVDRRGQLKGIERSQVLGETDAANQLLGRLEMRAAKRTTRNRFAATSPRNLRVIF